MAKQVELRFNMERETKNTVRFQEVTAPGEEDTAQIGTLYVQKKALRELGYDFGINSSTLVMTLSLD